VLSGSQRSTIYYRRAVQKLDRQSAFPRLFAGAPPQGAHPAEELPYPLLVAFVAWAIEHTVDQLLREVSLAAIASGVMRILIPDPVP
jgi:hypothetical protein